MLAALIAAAHAAAYVSSPTPAMKICALCGREIPPALESRHHLVPKLKGGKTTEENIVVLHRPCHDKIHAVFTERELAHSYDSVDELLAHPDIDKFVRWIKKRPIEFRDGTTSLRRRRQRGRMLLMAEGLEAESDSVGPGIYGGRVSRDTAGDIIIGQQYEDHNALPGPVYAGGGYSDLSAAIRISPQATRLVLDEHPDAASEITTGGATPLHVCGMSKAGERSTSIVLEALGTEANVEATDTWGYTALQRHASNNLAEGAHALLDAGASHTSPSGLEGTGDSARALALRFRHFATLKVFQQFELAQGLPLPEGEIEL